MAKDSRWRLERVDSQNFDSRWTQQASDGNEAKQLVRERARSRPSFLDSIGIHSKVYSTPLRTEGQTISSELLEGKLLDEEG